MLYLLHQLYSLPLLLLPQTLPSLSLLESFAEWVVVVKLHLLRNQNKKKMLAPFLSLLMTDARLLNMQF